MRTPNAETDDSGDGPAVDTAHAINESRPVASEVEDR